jgi:uncharacterized protein
MTSPVTWFELTGTDTAALCTFYADLFGWEISPVDGMDYGAGGIGGGITAGDGAGTVVYLQVDDIQATLDRIERAGGKTVVPVTVIPDMVTFAQFADPEGNVVGLTAT